jgi:OmpA-OmpF porin, OOP family
MNIIYKNLKITLFLVAIQTITIQKIIAQEVLWANKLIELTDIFQFENNFAEYVLGPPTIYPQEIDIHEEKFDSYAEGYIIHYDNTRKKNTVTVGFPKAINANQVVIGGIFNPGTIYSIYVLDKNGKERLAYKFNKVTSKVKFRNFTTTIPYSTIYGIKVVFDHSKITDWNIVKGIGVLLSTTLYQVKPNNLNDTTHNFNKILVKGNINSDDCHEFAPKIAPDGKTLYFVRECINKPDQDIWYAELDSASSTWKEPKNIGVPLNNKDHNYIASISADGKKLIVGNKYKSDGSFSGDGVSISEKQSDGKWSNPKAIEITDYVNINEHANFFMNANEDVLLMALEDKNSAGALDLYVSFLSKTSNNWSTPLNLGLNINTSFDEDYPYLSNDNKTLYFSSKGYIGFGGHDIYTATRLDESWTNWTKPQNIGSYMNTKADDKGFVISNEGDHAYFNAATLSENEHHMDIYKVDLPKTLYQERRVLVSGRIFSKKNNQPLLGNVTIKDEKGKTMAFGNTNPNTGHFALSVLQGKIYNLISESTEHYNLIEPLQFNDPTTKIEFTKDFYLEPFMDTGKVYKLDKILFETNSSSLLEESYAELDRIAANIKQQSKSTFEVAGHTDSLGTVEWNTKLSYYRAESVVKYLVSKGIKENRLTPKGYGSGQPVETNLTPEGRAFNRRVEVKILIKDTTPKSNKANKLKSSVKKSNTK